jgi:hypothetical protein
VCGSYQSHMRYQFYSVIFHLKICPINGSLLTVAINY